MATEPDLGATASLVLDHALAQPASLGRGRLISIDGPAGSGKTTVAYAVATQAKRAVATVALLHLDDLYEGWTGLGDELIDRIDHDILTPLAADQPGRYRRWDWHSGTWAETHLVDPVALLVVEGVGAAAAAYDDRITTRVWVEAPTDLRIARGLERDGADLAPQWASWLEVEQEWFAAERTRERADIVVDGTGARPSVRCNPPY